MQPKSAPQKNSICSKDILIDMDDDIGKERISHRLMNRNSVIQSSMSRENRLLSERKCDKLDEEDEVNYYDD